MAGFFSGQPDHTILPDQGFRSHPGVGNHEISYRDPGDFRAPLNQFLVNTRNPRHQTIFFGAHWGFFFAGGA